MADDVKDVAIYTGSEWTSLSELAAGVVDAKLPIESVDGSVTLQSPEVNKYQIIVGGASRVDVGTSDITFRDSLIFSEWQSKGDSPSKITLDAQATINVGGKVFNVASNESDLAEGDGGVYTYNRTGVYSVISNGIHFNSNAAGGVKSVSWKMDADGSFAAKTATQSIQCANYRGQSPNELNGLSVSDVVAVTVDGENKLEISSEAVKCRDAVWCDTFLPYDGAGAKLSLSSNALWTIDTKLLEFTSNTGGVAGGSGLYVRNRTDDLAFVSDGIRFNSNASGGVLAVNWVMDTKGDLVAQTSNQEIECTNYRGQGDNTDNGFTIDSSVKVTVNGDTRLNISSSAISAWPEYEPSGLKDLVTREYCDNAASPSALPISSTDDTVTLQSPAADEFEVELAGEIQLRITDKDIQAAVGYEGLSDNSLITRSMLYGHGEGGTPIAPPGYNSGEIWESVDYPNASPINGPHTTLAADGIFSNGRAWSVNGKDWFATNSRIDGLGIYPIAYSDGAYVTYRRFSYDMKNWAEIRRGGITAPFFWQGYFFCASTGGVVSGGGQNTGSGSWGPGTRPGYGRTIPPDRPVLPAAFNYRIFRAATSDWEVPTYDWAIKPLADDVVDGADQYQFVILHQSSKPDGTMTLASQEMNNNLLDKRVCYIADNPNITIDRPWSWEFVQVPGLTEISGTALKGIAYDESEDRWVVLTDGFSFVCRGNPSTSTWRKYPLPNAGDWCENFHFNGENFIAVTSATGSNLCISSSDGENWLRSTSINIASDSNYLCGTNGRSLLVTPYSSSIQPTPPMQLTGGLAITGPTTADVSLTEPVETTAAYTQRTGRATLTTQEDANVYFNDAINLRAFVVTLTQADYDAIPNDQLDDQTLYCITD